jgi:alpha-tubulin suppressor-like RCC1 family protein
LGLGDTTDRNTPARVGTGFVSVAAGKYHSLGLKADGTLWAWGRNDFGQLGLGDTDNRNIPVKVVEDAWPWVAVAAGLPYLALKADSGLGSGAIITPASGSGDNNDQILLYL